MANSLRITLEKELFKTDFNQLETEVEDEQGGR